MAEFTFEIGNLNNRQDPIRLGRITDFRDPTISTLTQAENVDIDSSGLVTRRGGRTQRLAGAPHSFWVRYDDDTVSYFCEAGILKRFNTDNTATTLATLGSNLSLSFEMINDQVVVSNPTNIGWVEESVYTAFAPTLGTLELATPPGQYVAFYNGVLYVASGSSIYASKPYNVEVMDSRFCKFPMGGYIRMCAAVEDGLWVATDKRVGFIQGGGTEEFRYVDKTDEVPADGCFGLSFEGSGETARRVVRWASKDGFCRGTAGGSFESLSLDTVALPTGSSGKCFHTNNNGIDQYIAVIHDPSGSEAFVPPTLVLNTLTVS